MSRCIYVGIVQSYDPPQHVLEIRQMQHISQTIRRLTPACAGNTSGRITSPNSCGDPPPAHAGRSDIPTAKFRLIAIHPACAGRSYHTLEYKLTQCDSPRTCGKKIEDDRIVVRDIDPPPHVREISISATSSSNPYDPPRICGKKGFLEG